MATTPDIQYVVSLDSLDISLLNRILRPSDEKQLLWSVPKQGRETGLYRLEIAPDTNKNIYESVETYLCHVCNIKVPRMYTKEHITSEKHKTLKKLTELIIENNLKENIDHQDIDGNDINSHMFFCDSCCKAMRMEHKLVHYRSSEHLKSIKSDELTAAFVKVYVGEDDKTDEGNEKIGDVEEDIDDVVELSTVMCERAEGAFDANVFPINHVGGHLNSVLEVNLSDSNVDKNADSSAKVPTVAINNDFNSDIEGNDDGIANASRVGAINKDFKTYLKTAVQRYMDRSEYLMDCESVMIVTPSGFTEEMNADTFHNILYCDRCLWFLYRERNLRCTSRRFNEKILVSKVKEAWRQCFLCKKPDADECVIFCYTCKIYSSEINHYYSKEHNDYAEFKVWLSKKYISSDDSSDSSGDNYADNDDNYSITSEVYSDYCKQFIALGGTKSKCRVCRVNVPYIGDNIVEHVEGNKHQNLLKTLLQRHEIEETTSIVYYCRMCKTYTGNFMDHIERNIHRKNWKRLSGEINKYKLKKYVYGNYKRCEEATVYQNVYEELLEQNKVLKQKNGTFFCTPCGIQLNRTNEIFHIFGSNHCEGFHNFLSPYTI